MYVAKPFVISGIGGRDGTSLQQYVWRGDWYCVCCAMESTYSASAT